MNLLNKDVKVTGAFISNDWELIKTKTFWTLVHKDCEGFISGPPTEVNEKSDRCSRCGRRVDRMLMKKLPFLIKMDQVNAAWSGDKK